VIKRSNIVRTLEIDRKIVNVTHALDGDGRAEMHFNFHHDTPSAEDAGRVIEGRATAGLELAKKIMTTVYDCPQEETNDQN
jgi:hypothetical protein